MVGTVTAVSTPEFDPTTVPVRDAATVMLVRDGEAGLEVFMMRRNLGASFAGGMYAFPGGAVDAADRTAEVEALVDGRTDADASRLLELDRGGLAFWSRSSVSASRKPACCSPTLPTARPSASTNPRSGRPASPRPGAPCTTAAFRCSSSAAPSSCAST